MCNSNITEYKNREKEFHMYYGKVSLRKGFYVTNFDEGYYHLVGVSIWVSITELLHPDDIEPFLKAVESLSEGPQHLLFRLMCVSGEDSKRYRYFYATIRKNGKIIENEESFDMELCEIMAITDQYRLYRNLITKYREYMSMIPCRFMEYDMATDELKIYEYNARQCHIIFSGILDQLKIGVDASETLEARQKLEFENFYSTLTRGQDHAIVQIDSACIPNTSGQTRLEIKTGIIFDEGVCSKSVGIINIISSEQPKKSYYLSESAYDPGTGLLNKRAINEYAIEKIQNKTEGLCIAIIDLDDFKKINDNFGHMKGDEVLSRVAEIMKSVVSNRGAVGRFGGDEFMIILEGYSTQDDLRRVLSTVSANVRWAFSDQNGPKVTLSIGSSMYPVDGDNYEELFQKADKCVYIAKSKGKNRFIMYDEKKHGSLVLEDGSRSNIGLKATYSDEKKNDIVSDLTLDLYTCGMDKLIPVMEQMQSYFDIDGIAVYSGENLDRICSVGKYFNPIESLNFIKMPEYQENFNEQGFYEENQMIRLQKKVPHAFMMYSRQENGKLIQCQALRDGVVTAVVSFDFFNRSPKHGTTDLGLIKIVGRVMAEVVAKGI